MLEMHVSYKVGNLISSISQVTLFAWAMGRGKGLAGIMNSKGSLKGLKNVT